MAIDIYSTRAQLAALELLPREYSFLFDTFVTDGGTVEDDKAIFDVRKGGRPMAPFVHTDTGAVNMEREGYNTKEISFCEIAPQRTIDKHDLMKRAFGEDVLGAMTPEQRARKMLAQDMVDMRKAIQRRLEWMARQIILTGKLDIFRYTHEGRDRETTLVADFDFQNNLTTTAWDQTGHDIEGDFNQMFDMVYDGGGYVDIILMDPASAAVMLQDDVFMKQYDRKNVEMGEINTKYRGSGIRYLGTNSLGVEMYSMAGNFLDDDGVTKPVLPRGTVIAGSKGMLKCIYGPVTQVEGYGEAATFKTYIKKQVPKRIGDPNTNVIANRIISRPMMMPMNADGWALATVL